MHLWFLNQFYPPDHAPTGVMLEAVVERLARDGHECVVWCSGGSYANPQPATSSPQPATPNPPRPGIRVERVGTLGAGKSFFAKLKGWLGFYVVLGYRLLTARERPDGIVAMTTPPFLSVLARVAAWRHGAWHGHWVMDLYPDVLVAHGMLREGGPGHRLLAAVARWGFGGKRAGALLTIGPCMAERMECLIQSGGAAPPGPHEDVQQVPGHGDDAGSPPPLPYHAVSWIPLWSGSAGCGDLADLEEKARQLRQERGWAEDECVVMYSGNLGRGHVVAPVLECALGMAADGGRRVRWVFCAHGARLDEVKQFAAAHPELGVEFLEPVPAGLLDAHLASADVHLASLAESWSGCMVPSKLQGIFAVGRPVMFVGGAESSIGQWVAQSGGGWVARADDAAGIRTALEEARDPNERTRRGAAARRFAEGHFDRETNAARVAKLFSKR